MAKSNNKQILVNTFGGKCQICGYKENLSSLSFHHIDPNEKEFNISKYSNNKTYSFEFLNELSKVILVCENCHREIHNGKYDNDYLEGLDRFDLYDAMNY
jgi:hypothetical protein